MRATVVAAMVTLAVAGCSQNGEEAATGEVERSTPPEAAPPAQPPTDRLVTYTEQREPCANYSEERMPLFGDVHVHTSYSFDAAANSTGTTPVDANRFARGEAIPFWPLDADGRPAGSRSIDRPLDFLAVTDHGEFLGERALCRTPESPAYDSAFCRQYRSDQRMGMRMLGTVITTETPERIPELCGEDGELCREWAEGPWQRIVDAAEAAYDRSSTCAFTSFVGYEYTGTPGTSNYHRNVIFRNAEVPDRPVTYIDAPADTLLWNALDDACGGDCDYLTIPHNSNLANGRMGPYMAIEPTLANRRDYAEQRQRREPIMEIFQHKGQSECINGLTSILSEPDELCDLEQVRTLGKEEVVPTQQMVDGEVVLGQTTQITEECADGEVGSNGMVGAGCVDETDFIRSGLLVGLAEEAETGVNPIKLGMIGSTDTHASTPGAVSETDWGGHVTGEATPQERLQPGLLTSGIEGNPGGLAGVWAVENSRDAIFEAMLRREVFGTSGPRIVPRFFAGWSFGDDLCGEPDMVTRGYADGVPMGGDLEAAPAENAAPSFVAYAARDPQGAPLERLQLIKGWIDGDGAMHAEVVDIAGSADNGAGVDLATGERTGGGHDTLCTVYTDEDFDPAQSAYYYLRVLENPSARWSVHDCLRIPEDERPAVCTDGSVPEIIHEMAWTSPIWYRPEG